MPYLLCLACLAEALRNSKAAIGIYEEMVESYRLPDVKAAFAKLETELGPDKLWNILKENTADFALRVGGRKDELKSLPPPDAEFFRATIAGVPDYRYVFEEWMDAKTDSFKSEDFKYWFGLMDEFIRVGFNNASRRGEGDCRLTIDNAGRLALIIHLVAWAEHKRFEVVSRGECIAFRISGRTYDLTELWAMINAGREGRRRARAYARAKYERRQLDKIRRMARLWYGSRVEWTGPTEFCRRRELEGTEFLPASDVSAEIRECDEAMGYPRGEHRRLK
jgi:hypothetical protein